MRFYHGSTVENLTMLEPVSRGGPARDVVYLTDNRAYCLFYIRDREIDYVTCGVRRVGIVQYEEKFPGQLKEMYSGVSGWCYGVDAEAEPTRIPGIWGSRQAAVVVDRTYIPDVYDAVRGEISRGSVAFLRYEDLTAEPRSLNHQGIVRCFLTDSAMNPQRAAFFRKHFPEAWEEAQNILAQYR